MVRPTANPKSTVCPHCDPHSFALAHPLKRTNNFYVVCDAHPLTEGHILIIPKGHMPCVGAFTKKRMQEFIMLYSQVSQFISSIYGTVCTFEHGVVGQTVPHAHVHLLPCTTTSDAIIPEGKYKAIHSIFQIPAVYNAEGKYLFFTIDSKAWIVDTSISEPRFFRDRFAQVLRKHNRGNWKKMRKSKKIMKQAQKEIENVKNKWMQHASNKT